MTELEHKQTTASKADIRRQQILDAATCCFLKSGFHGASMAEIAKSFGMSAGHIYNYFESKEAIIEAIVKRDMEQALERIANLSGERDVLSAILAAVDESVQRRLARSALDAEIFAEAARNPRVADVVRKTDAVIRQNLQELLLQTMKKSSLPAGQLDAKTSALLALFDGLMIRSIREPSIAPAALGGELKGLIRHLLA